MEYIVMALAYLFGSVPWALVIGKVFYKTDIREHGSGNLGGTNAGRVLGKTAGLTVSFMDIMKAFIAVGLGSIYGKDVGAICGILATIGHCYPIFANFKGGKAVSTSMGFLFATIIFLGVHWAVFVVPAVSFFVILKLTKMVSLSSMSTFVIAVIMSWIIPTDLTIRITIIILAVIIIYRHRANIKRILNKTESKVKWI